MCVVHEIRCLVNVRKMHKSKSAEIWLRTHLVGRRYVQAMFLAHVSMHSWFSMRVCKSAINRLYRQSGLLIVLAFNFN